MPDARAARLDIPGALYEHVFDSVIVACALIPRLSLSSALGDRRELLGRPVALAPEPGGPQVIGEASGAAEAFGSAPGCGSARRWLALPCAGPGRARPGARRGDLGALAARLEAIGAAVEPSRPGEAFFATEPLRALCGGPEAVLARARRALERRRRRRGRRPEPAQRATQRRCGCAPAGRRWWSPSAAAARLRCRACRSSALRGRLARPRAGAEPRPAERAGGGDLHRLARAARGAHPGRARRAARRPRSPTASASPGCGRCGWRAAPTSRFAPAARTRRSSAASASPEAASGQQLERALGLLIERLLAHPARAGADDPHGCGSRLRLAGRRRLARGGGPAQRQRRAPSGSAGARPAARRAPRARRLARPAGARARPERRRAAGARAARPPTSAAGGSTEAVRQARSAGRARRGPAGGRGRPRLARPRAPGDPGPVRRARWLSPQVYWPQPVAGRGAATTGRRSRSAGSRSRRCARTGWSRTAGGRRNPCKGAISRSCSPTAATSSSSASRADGGALVRAAGVMAVRRAARPLLVLVLRRRLAARGARDRARPSTATRPSRSPTTTTSAGRWSSPRRAGSSACGRSTAPS